MPLECSHSFRNFILWVGSKSTTLNDFWKPLWCTDTQAYTFTQQSLKFFRFLCRPIQSPQHLEGKKTTWTPHTNIITSAWCHFIPALSCAATSHQGSWNGPWKPCKGVEQYIQHGSSSLEFIYLVPNMILKKSDLVLCEGHSKAKQILAEGHASF